MSTLTDTAQSVQFEDGLIVVHMQSGAQFRFPPGENPRLAGGTSSQLNHVEISPFGLHWPELDEDLSLQGIAAGDYGQRAVRSL